VGVLLLSDSINQDELLLALSTIKKYIDESCIELKYENGFIYKRYMADEEWEILLDMSNLSINNGKVIEGKQIELNVYNDNIYWKYKNEDQSKDRILIPLEKLKGEDFDINKTYEDLGNKSLVNTIGELKAEIDFLRRTIEDLMSKLNNKDK
jgi:hypothetical protein